MAGRSDPNLTSRQGLDAELNANLTGVALDTNNMALKGMLGQVVYLPARAAYFGTVRRPGDVGCEDVGVRLGFGGGVRRRSVVERRVDLQIEANAPVLQHWSLNTSRAEVREGVGVGLGGVAWRASGADGRLVGPVSWRAKARGLAPPLPRPCAAPPATLRRPSRDPAPTSPHSVKGKTGGSVGAIVVVGRVVLAFPWQPAPRGGKSGGPRVGVAFYPTWRAGSKCWRLAQNKAYHAVLAVQVSFHFARHSSISAAPKSLIFGNFAEFRRLVGPLGDPGGGGGRLPRPPNRGGPLTPHGPHLAAHLMLGGGGGGATLHLSPAQTTRRAVPHRAAAPSDFGWESNPRHFTIGPFTAVSTSKCTPSQTSAESPLTPSLSGTGHDKHERKPLGSITGPLISEQRASPSITLPGAKKTNEGARLRRGWV